MLRDVCAHASRWAVATCAGLKLAASALMGQLDLLQPEGQHLSTGQQLLQLGCRAIDG